MGLGSSCSVEIEISNKTQNITLKNPRTYFGLGHCSKPPLPEVSPGSSDTCRFSGDPKFWRVLGTKSVKGILVYEAESFTLAIYFYNPSDHEYLSMRLGLELSPRKAHRGKLRPTYHRMANGTYSSSGQDIKFACVIVDESHGTVQVSHGPIKVMAAMSKTMSSTIKVALEEQKESREEAERAKLQDGKRARSRISKILRDLLRDLKDSPGSA